MGSGPLHDITGQDVILTTQLLLLPRLIIGGVIPPLPDIPS